MKIAKYWARRTGAAEDEHGKTYRLICWSGSNSSLAIAKAKAIEKLALWSTRVRSGNAIVDPYPYGPDEIREELIQEVSDRQGSLIAAITRNRYGALVLNTANVMFIDVDLPASALVRPGLFSRIISLVKPRIAEPKAMVTARQKLRQNFRDFHSNNTSLSLRVYMTAAGFRLVVLNKTIDPVSNEATQILDALGSDSLYRILCKNQECFRARLTPKPWRCGSENPQGRFPREEPSQQAAFSQWLESYERKIKNYAVCTEVETLGSHDIDPTVDQVLSLHDQYVIKTQAMKLA